MAWVVKVDQTSTASAMRLVHVGRRFGDIGQMCSPFQAQTLFQKPMEGPKVEPNEQLSEQEWSWLAKRALIALDRRLKMSFFDLKCYGLTCKNVLPALGGEHFAKKIEKMMSCRRI